MKVLESYNVNSDGIISKVTITEGGDFVRRYDVKLAKFEKATRAVMDSIKEKLITGVKISSTELLNPKAIEALKEKFRDMAEPLVDKHFAGLSHGKKAYIVGHLLHEMLGLGLLEVMLSDENLEEIVVNASTEPVWVYHKKFGWLKSNVIIPTEAQIHTYASTIGRRVGRQITTLSPLLDAHLVTQDRANATLYPISAKGNTITIRRFARDPWTIPDFIESNTISSEVTALLWLALQYELNIIVSGGTGSGKTSMLQVMLPFIQPFHRIVSIEDTRELQLPVFLHWVPLTTREANAEGKGEVTMLDLMVNALRMRPDRIVVGEMRRHKEAEVLFEAMNTGHSVYSTLHADTAEQTIRRLVNAPIAIPPVMLEAVHLNVVMFRDRRRNIRRVLQVAEFVSSGRERDETLSPSVLYRWNPSSDKIEQKLSGGSIRVYEDIALHTSMTAREIDRDLVDKTKVLDWMVKRKVGDVDMVGRIMAEHYRDESVVQKMAARNADPLKAFGD